MQYLLLIHQGDTPTPDKPDEWARLSEDEQKAVYTDYQAEYGRAEPYAIYGYEAGKLILDVLNRAEDPTDRASVIEALFATQDRDSILGTYSIDENGDTSLTDYGVFTIDGGELVFDEKISTTG